VIAGERTSIRLVESLVSLRKEPNQVKFEMVPPLLNSGEEWALSTKVLSFLF